MFEQRVLCQSDSTVTVIGWRGLCFLSGFLENERDVKRLRGFLLYSFSVY
jgi:hypothetical protein